MAPDLSIQDQLKKLVELQKIDIDIYAHKKDLAEKPAHIEVLKKQYEDKKAHLHELEEKHKKALVQRKERELDLEAKEGDIVKANAQLSELKTNKEYQAKITEIENIKADKSLVEEQILRLYDEADAIQSEIEKEKGYLAEQEKVFQSEKKKVEDEMKLINDQMAVLENKRKQLTPDIDPNNLKRYEKILENKAGLALVPVRGDSCGGCFMNVPAQSINEIKMHERLILCEMCSRILYLEDDL